MMAETSTETESLTISTSKRLLARIRGSAGPLFNPTSLTLTISTTQAQLDETDNFDR